MKQATPRRRIRAEIQIDADDWQELRSALRQLETKMFEDGGELRSHVSGGYSSGWIVEADEDTSIDHDIWAENLRVYLDTLEQERRP